MAKSDILTSVTANIDRSDAEDFALFERSGGKIQPWQNHTAEETVEFLRQTFSTLKQIKEADLFDSLPFQQLNQINSSLNNFWAQYDSAKAVDEAQQTNQHHNPLNQLHAVDNVIRTSGLFAIANLSPNIVQNSESIDRQLENLNKAVADATQLQDQVRKLINPSTAQALSTAFAKRCFWIMINKWIWFTFLALGVTASIIVTVNIQSFVDSILGSDASTLSAGAVGWVLRGALILPLYAFTGFAFAQYRRERIFEENYAHKSAIAETLPSYTEIIRDPELSDSITKAMTEVVFRSPAESNKTPKAAKSNSTASELVELLNSVKTLLGQGE